MSSSDAKDYFVPIFLLRLASPVVSSALHTSFLLHSLGGGNVTHSSSHIPTVQNGRQSKLGKLHDVKSRSKKKRKKEKMSLTSLWQPSFVGESVSRGF